MILTLDFGAIKAISTIIFLVFIIDLPIAGHSSLPASAVRQVHWSASSRNITPNNYTDTKCREAPPGIVVKARYPEPQSGLILLLCKIYTEDVKLHYSDKATGVTVKVEIINEKESNIYAVRSNGRFTTELELNKKYMISISKKGFETKCFKISTKKVFTNDRQYLAFNILLKKEKAANYDRKHPVASIEYNDVSNNFECTILQESGSNKAEPFLTNPNLTNSWSF
ncbi:MAG: hypothetical protein COC01_09760 [Bacteroidetes bacterium]|nr:MAG: hypothetical protein COC01_09760 [Bacteroidota bacterium]